MSGDIMFKSLFKKNQITPAQEQALNQANLALRSRTERMLHEGAAKHFGQAKETDKSHRRIFEGQVAA